MLNHIRFKISNLLDVCNSSESGGDRCSATPVWSSLTELFDSELRLKSRLKVDNAIHLFAIDIVVIFNSAYYEDEIDLIDNRKKIACKYMKGWFTIDVLSVIPFDNLLN